MSVYEIMAFIAYIHTGNGFMVSIPSFHYVSFIKLRHVPLGHLIPSALFKLF